MIARGARGEAKSYPALRFWILTPPAAEDGGLASQKISLAFLILRVSVFSEIWKENFLLGFRAKRGGG